MNRFFIGLIAVALLASLPLYGSDEREQSISDNVSADTNSTETDSLKKVMEQDDAAMDEINKWIQDNQAFAAQGVGESKAELNKKILARLQDVRTNYVEFLERYPTNADAYLAYGSFLNDIGDEDGASTQYEKSRQINPKNPAVWNDLANYYGEHGPITNAFIYYAKAINLNSNEPVYYENMATTVYLYRKDAEQYYGINEAQVFDKALALYRQAIEHDPDNFPLRTDYAESYYEIRPMPVHDALLAWTNALGVAHTELEREGVYIHLARIKIAAGRLAEAQVHLDAVTNATLDTLKNRLQRNLIAKEKGTTNSAPWTGEALAVTNTPASSSGQKAP